ncbi:hypothetical protein LEN26_009010 [Aphanomyces euteiches]|nr:hypothetical protein LEN26_009010 [Aphanomyces euteiches]KAH9191017.1 hypothetical protein AeNC1_007009 [Aphanomyces euteiches]
MMQLPPDFFKCSPLTPEEYEEYTDLAMQNMRDLLEKADISNPRYKWKRVANEAELEIFRGKDPYRPTSAAKILTDRLPPHYFVQLQKLLPRWTK